MSEARLISDEEEVIESVENEIAEESGCERFVIDDDSKADWAVRKIAEAEAEKQRWKDYYARAYETIASRQDGRIEYLKRLLMAYFETVPHKETKTQASYGLPSGKLVLKRQAPTHDVDDAVLLPWLKENMPQAIKVKESSSWTDMLKGGAAINGGALVTADGEIIPGVTITEREAKFAIE